MIEYPIICPDCGEEEEFCCCDEFMEAYAECDDMAKCGCPYCHCSNETLAGSICNECRAGSHQG